jgi:hypothetical protein
VYLPVTAPVGTAVEDFCDQCLQVGSGDTGGMDEVVVVGGTSQPRRSQQVGEEVPLPCERFDYRGFIAVADLDARRARTFPR